MVVKFLMFTGIVEETGSVVAFNPGANGWRLSVSAGLVASDASLGDSIAVNGCCLTVVQRSADRLEFDVLEETRRLTNFGDLVPGGAVNLERSLSASGRIGGHFVTGHVDVAVPIAVFEARGADHYMRVSIGRNLARHVVHKGSVAIDGISLTVAEAGPDFFSVWLIPHTLQATNLRARRAGEKVNVEFDLIGKHVERLMQVGVPF